MKWTHSGRWEEVELEVTEEVKDKIVTTILDLYREIGFSGEHIIQFDAVYLNAPTVLADLADELSFKITYTGG